jgi:hypothetical protein
MTSTAFGRVDASTVPPPERIALAQTISIPMGDESRNWLGSTGYALGERARRCRAVLRCL